MFGTKKIQPPDFEAQVSGWPDRGEEGRQEQLAEIERFKAETGYDPMWHKSRVWLADAYECLRCSAVVSNRHLHDEWHDSLG